MKRSVFILSLLAVFILSQNFVFAHSIESRKAELIRKLSKVFPRSKLSAIFSDKRLALDYSVLPPTPLPSPRTDEERKQREEEAKRKLDESRAKLLSHDSVSRGIKYLKDHKKVLEDAENKPRPLTAGHHTPRQNNAGDNPAPRTQGIPKERGKRGVDRYVIASILRNETNFGNFIGVGHPVINTLYSMYVLMPDWRNFAVRELACFIKIADASGWKDIFSVPGSNRGAFGYAQFIPCSFSLAVDGNGDGKKDLFNHDDAIFSIENYLVRYWSERPGNQRTAILRYNPDTTYLEFVISYRGLLMLYDTPEH